MNILSTLLKLNSVSRIEHRFLSVGVNVGPSSSYYGVKQTNKTDTESADQKFPVLFIDKFNRNQATQ